MAGICGPNPILHLHRTTTQSPLNLHRVHGGARWCCCSVSPENENKTRTPPLLRLAVSGVTELLRLFSSSAQGNRADYQLKTEDRDENSASDIDDVLRILKADYENAYFVTGCQHGNRFCSGNLEIKNLPEASMEASYFS
ncbi:hypothetical protein V6Z11_A08G264800 [Gossypium hirsutum]